MLKPEKMVKVSIIGPRDLFEATVEKLYRLNLLHVEELKEDGYFRVGEPLEKAPLTSRNLLQIRSYLSYLKVDSNKIIPKKKYKEKEIREQLSRKLGEYNELVGKKIEEIRSINEKLRFLEEEINTIEPLKLLDISPKFLRGYKSLKVFVGYVKKDPSEEIAKITNVFEIFKAEYKKELVVAVFVKNEVAEEVLKVLQVYGFKEIPVPEVEDFDAKLSEIEKTKKELNERKSKLEIEIEEIKVKETELLLAIEEFLSSEAEKSELPLRTLISKYTFVVAGYIPVKKLNEFKKSIEELKKVTVEILDGESGTPPTKLSNPSFVKNFEILSTTYAIPKYKEIDPTWMMSIFFTIFFGMMLGDIGYGLSILVASLYLKRIFKTEGWQRLLNIGVYVGVSSMFFGFIYGEFFGPFIVPGFKDPNEVHFLGKVLYDLYAFNHHHPIFDRIEEFGIKALLFIVLMMGMFKMLLGFALGFYNVYLEHGFKEAIFEKGCWFMGVLGLVFLILGFSYNVGIFTLNPPSGFGEILPKNLYIFGPYTVEDGSKVPLPIPGLIDGWEAGVNVFYLAALPLIVLWFIIFIKAEIPKMGAFGVVMVVELLTWLGQIISYARLLAIGLSSVYIAFVVNYISLKLAHPPGIALLPIAIIIMILFHGGNFLLGILDPGLQSLRLHYVEFFTKFFEGGGKLYRPFGRVKKFVEEGGE
ncbi:MAG: V-type ATP synthase subunit I [Archaeoglobaceae archaeon]|nr:V-type ATP synthase subunit I [Archaeoglobaceae archaeon]MCX8152657.1 V-type ATP synthase subunit I [Archaeoglobaceae archaeon]MDW8014061.1 V-type ATP synthase subunit I [Archaeoglobaceae archaeon]